MDNERNDEMEIDLLELLDALRKKVLYIIAAGLLGACISAAGTQFLITPTYTSTASMLVIDKRERRYSFSGRSFRLAVS